MHLIVVFTIIFVYIFFAVVVGRIADKLFEAVEESPLCIFAGMFWPITVMVILMLQLSKKPVEWLLSKLQ